MIRSKRVQASWLRLGIVSLLVAVGGCTHPASHSESTGDFRFSLMLSSLAEIDAVAYTVSGNGIKPITGTIDVTGVNTTSAVISGLPAAMGYSFAATAASTDGKTKCVGNTTFSITDGSQTSANLILECTGPNESGTGVVRIDGSFDNCPVVTSLVAIPASGAGATTDTISPIPVGSTATLIGTYRDLDGDDVTFSWSQNPIVGSFGANTAARTLFTCVTPGVGVLTLAVSDGTCTKSGTMSIACVAAVPDASTSGQGGTAAGGAPGAGGAGAGGATGGTGSGGTGIGGSGIGGNTSTGGSGAGGTSGVGGDVGTGGNVGVGGAIGTGDSGVGGSVGTGGTSGVGGSGVGGTGVGGAGVGGSATGGSGAGGAGVGGGTGGMIACTASTPPDQCVPLVCEQCTFGAMPGDPNLCDSTPESCFNCDATTMGCELMTNAADKALCENLYACLVAPTHPGDPTFPGYCLGTGGDALPCWCGSNGLSCPNGNTAPSKANGTCVDLVQAAAHLTTYDAPTISAQFVNPALPLGAAVNLAICRGTFCAPECVLPK